MFLHSEAKHVINNLCNFRNVKNIKKLSETELKYNISGKASWHHQYKDSAWVFIGGLPYDLSEGDVICIFSQ